MACLLLRFAAPDGQRLLLFLDDINLPAKEQYGAQPPLELLRSLQDKGGMYDRWVASSAGLTANWSRGLQDNRQTIPIQ
jgi:hypothetical protein